MRFKTDENLHPEAADRLRSKGHDALTVWDQGLTGKPDGQVAEVCQREGRVLVTLDTGFADIRSYPPESFPGIVVLRLGQQSRKNVLEVLSRVLGLLDRELLAGRLWVVDEHNVRVRGSGSAGHR